LDAPQQQDQIEPGPVGTKPSLLVGQVHLLAFNLLPDLLLDHLFQELGRDWLKGYGAVVGWTSSTPASLLEEDGSAGLGLAVNRGP